MNALFMVLGYFETIIGRTLLLKFTLVSHLSSGTILELETSSFSCLVFILLCVIIYLEKPVTKKKNEKKINLPILLQ
jgi:hypothetical protein